MKSEDFHSSFSAYLLPHIIAIRVEQLHKDGNSPLVHHHPSVLAGAGGNVRKSPGCLELQGSSIVRASDRGSTAKYQAGTKQTSGLLPEAGACLSAAGTLQSAG